MYDLHELIERARAHLAGLGYSELSIREHEYSWRRLLEWCDREGVSDYDHDAEGRYLDWSGLSDDGITQRRRAGRAHVVRLLAIAETGDLPKTSTENGRPVSGTRTLQRLRREAGYHSAKEFAERLGMPAPTYARYERQPDGPETGIPMKAAWKIADVLGCSIDLVVGRDPDEARGSKVRRMYNGLTPGSRERLDEYLDFIEYKERVMTQQRRWE